MSGASRLAARPEPVVAARLLGHASSPRWRTVARAVAVRELILGAGTLLAVRRGRPQALWLRAMAAADALDGTLIATLAVRGTSAPALVAANSAFAFAGVAGELALARLRPPRG